MTKFWTIQLVSAPDGAWYFDNPDDYGRTVALAHKLGHAITHDTIDALPDGAETSTDRDFHEDIKGVVPTPNQFGMACPKCGRGDALDVAARVWVRLTLDGTDADAALEHDHDWDNESACRCAACGWSGKALNAIPNEKSKEG